MQRASKASREFWQSDKNKGHAYCLDPSPLIYVQYIKITRNIFFKKHPRFIPRRDNIPYETTI